MPKLIETAAHFEPFAAGRVMPRDGKHEIKDAVLSQQMKQLGFVFQEGGLQTGRGVYQFIEDYEHGRHYVQETEETPITNLRLAARDARL